MKKRMLVLLVVLAVLLTSLSALLPASASEPTKQDWLPLRTDEHVNINLTNFGSHVWGVHMTADAAFDGVYIWMSICAGSNGLINVKVYNWNTDYATSVAGAAIVDVNHTKAQWGQDDFVSGTPTTIKFNQAVNAGEYLILFSGSMEGNTILPLKFSYNHINKAPAGVEFFQNGNVTTTEQQNFAGGILYKPAVPTTVLWGTIGAGEAYFLYGNDASSVRSIGVRFNALNQFSKIKLGLHGGDKLTYTLYSWQDDYTTTIAGTPVCTVTDSAKQGTAVATIDLGQNIAKGEYLFVVAPASETPSANIAVWTSVSSVPDLVDYYCNGEKQTDETTDVGGAARSRCISGGIVYIDDTVDTFGTLSVKAPDLDDDDDDQNNNQNQQGGNKEENKPTGDGMLVTVALTIALACGVVIMLRRKFAHDTKVQ